MKASRSTRSNRFAIEPAVHAGRAVMVAAATLLHAAATAASGKAPSAGLASPGDLSRSPAAAPCSAALAAGAVCQAANDEASRLLAARRLAGAIVVQDVRSGVLISYASSSSSTSASVAAAAPAAARSAVALDVGSPILPLSFVKLLLAASWWDHEAAHAGAARATATAPIDVHEMVVSGSDSAGRRLALALRRAVGTEAVLADLERYGFPSPGRRPPGPPGPGSEYWAEIDPASRQRLGPAAAAVSISRDTKDADWASALSLGESGFSVTLLHLSRFLQAVGNDGAMVPPSVHLQLPGRQMAASRRQTAVVRRVMQAGTARRLQLALLDAVRRGSARGIRDRMGGAWQMGGKTGTGPGSAHPYDGCFAGLVFDPRGAPRFTVATYVKAGGRGGGVAAELSTDLARFIAGF